MNENDLLARMERCGVVPVVEVRNAAQAAPLLDALTAGGIDIIEVTLRTDDALAAIESVAGADASLVGAGTLLDTAGMRRAAAAGAVFGVSPGYDQELVDEAARLGLPYVPGVSTASDVQRAVAAGRKLLKLFPVEVAGGVAAVRALTGPFGAHGVRFMPTGGVREETLADYLSEPSVCAVGGTWIAPAADIDAGEWGQITARARAARAVSDAVRGRR